jgi:hypothetical protein
MDKAQIERITELALAAQGKPTKRLLKEILASEKSAAGKYIPRVPVTKTGTVPPAETES